MNVLAPVVLEAGRSHVIQMEAGALEDPARVSIFSSSKKKKKKKRKEKEKRKNNN